MPRIDLILSQGSLDRLLKGPGVPMLRLSDRPKHSAQKLPKWLAAAVLDKIVCPERPLWSETGIVPGRLFIQSG
jgi:hypothetical protein